MLFHKPSIRLRILRFLFLSIVVINARLFLTYISEQFIIYLVIFFAFKSVCPPYYIEKIFLKYFNEYEKSDKIKQYTSVISVYVLVLLLEWIILYVIFPTQNTLWM